MLRGHWIIQWYNLFFKKKKKKKKKLRFYTIRREAYVVLHAYSYSQLTHKEMWIFLSYLISAVSGSIFV